MANPQQAWEPGGAEVSARRWVGPAALGALGLVAMPLAAPGGELVPGAGEDPPGWLLGVYGDGFGLSGGAYLALLYVAFGAYLALAWAAPLLSLRTIAIAVGAAVVAFTLAPPLLSLDVFSYISYGRLQVEGLNPYDVAPEAIPGDEAASRVQDFSGATSVYGPLFTLLSHPVAALGVPAALWTMKALAGLSALALAALCARVAAARGLSGRRGAVLVGLNPILLVHGVGGAHNDMLMALGMLACAWLALTSRPARSGVAVVGAAAVKAAGGMIAPFALLGAWRAERPRFLAGAAVAAGVAAALALALYGVAAAGALDVLGGSQDRISRYSMPATLSRATGIDLDLIRAAALVSYGALVLYALWRVAHGGDWLRAAAWASFGVLLVTAYMTPWYVVWALPLVAVSRDRALLALTLGFTGYQLVNSIPL